MNGTQNAGYDEWLDAIADGEGFHLVCPEGHGSLPPRRVCPTCGVTELTKHPLPETGTLRTYTIVHVPTPQFAEDSPYATGIADFDAVRLTGVLRGVPFQSIETGMSVIPGVERTETDNQRLLTLRPQ